MRKFDIFGYITYDNIPMDNPYVKNVFKIAAATVTQF